MGKKYFANNGGVLITNREAFLMKFNATERGVFLHLYNYDCVNDTHPAWVWKMANFQDKNGYVASENEEKPPYSNYM